jgi:hypothetical protein
MLGLFRSYFSNPGPIRFPVGFLFCWATSSLPAAPSVVPSLSGTEFDGRRENSINLGRLYIRKRQFEKVEPFCAQALSIGETALGKTHANFPALVGNYALVLREPGRPGEAAALEARARTIRAESV